MKNPKLFSVCSLLMLVFLGLVVTNCEKDFYFVKKVNIKGKISLSTQKSISIYPDSSGTFALSDAKKVLIFYGKDFDLVNIRNDGSFSGRAPLGSATAVVFLTENYEFIGNLFAGGMNFLPLMGVENDYSEIDLSTLTLDGDRVIPSYDPVGEEIILTGEEIMFMQQVGSYYKSLAKNIDMNNDGTPDVLQKSLIEIYTVQNFRAGKWGLNGSAAELLPADQFTIIYSFFMEGPVSLVSSTDNSIPENATLSGPSGDPYTDIINMGNSYSNNTYFKVNFSHGHDAQSSAFKQGEYTLHIDNKEFTFEYSNIDMLDYWVLVIPKLRTNSENKVTAIELDYQFPDGTIVDPRKLLKTGIQVSIDSNDGEQILEIRSKESSPTDLDYDYYNITLETPIDLERIASIGLSYIDLFGNHGGNSWFSTNDF
jgi:hypothetical protein